MALMEFPTSQPTREDVRIRENRGLMGVIFLRKKGECRGLGSGCLVNLKGSKLFLNCKKIKWCLLTSDSYLPVNIGVEDYFFEYWSSDLKTVKKRSLREVAQSKLFYQPTAGLALIPVCPSLVSKLCTDVGLKSSVLDERRTFPTKYYYGGGESESCESIQCFIVGSYQCKKESLTVERFTLITERDDQRRLQYRLRDDVDKTIFRRYDDIITKRSHLCPRGAVILEVDGTKATCTCIGILNFTEEGLISPVFFTPETLTGKVQLYYPASSDVEEEASSDVEEQASSVGQTDSAVHSQDGPCLIVRGYGNKPQMFSSAGAENKDGASLTNDDQTVYPDDYTLQNWQKLYEEVKDENTQLKQQSERDQEVISILKDGNAELRNDIKKTEQQNEEIRAQIDDLCIENDDLRKRNDSLRSKNEELSTKNKELRKSWDAERKELLAENTELRKDWDTERKGWREENKELRAENNELRKEWNAESKELREVNKELRAENKELKAKNKELLTENEKLSASLKEVPEQLKELLSQPTSAVCGDGTSSIKDSDNVKAEGPSGSSANSPREDSDGSRKEEPFLDPLSKDVSKLD